MPTCIIWARTLPAVIVEWKVLWEGGLTKPYFFAFWTRMCTHPQACLTLLDATEIQNFYPPPVSTFLSKIFNNTLKAETAIKPRPRLLMYLDFFPLPSWLFCWHNNLWGWKKREKEFRNLRLSFCKSARSLPPFRGGKKWARTADHLQVQFDALAPEDTCACPDPS